MVQPKYSPEEALERVKLMMKYDSSKTLNENKKVIFEQSSPNEVAKIVSELRNSYDGDVTTTDLEDIQNILTSQVFGKTYEDGACLLNKVMEYFHTSYKSGPEGKYSLINAISRATEGSEPQFEDVKKKLLNLINSEISGFCKNPKVKDDSKKQDGGGVVQPRYRDCGEGPFTKGCRTSPEGVIGQVQTCLGGLAQDGKFWNKTEAKLKEKTGRTEFTMDDVKTICKNTQQLQPAEPEISGELPPDIDGLNTDF